MMIVVILSIVFVAVAVFIMWGIMTNNSMVRKRNNVENTFSSIDVMLKKRHDLIPNLVASIKSYTKHESDLLEKIVRLRNDVADTHTASADKINKENQLSGLLAQLKINVEQYPDLKANQNYIQLQATLNETEEQISAARRSFNSAVKSYNDQVEVFPASVLANALKFERKPFFEAAATERENVDVGALLA